MNASNKRFLGTVGYAFRSPTFPWIILLLACIDCRQINWIQPHFKVNNKSRFMWKSFMQNEELCSDEKPFNSNSENPALILSVGFSCHRRISLEGPWKCLFIGKVTWGKKILRKSGCQQNSDFFSETSANFVKISRKWNYLPPAS